LKVLARGFTFLQEKEDVEAKKAKSYSGNRVVVLVSDNAATQIAIQLLMAVLKPGTWGREANPPGVHLHVLSSDCEEQLLQAMLHRQWAS
jgi:hypothetical protein